MAVPALRALRAAAPEAEFWCLGPWTGSILEAEPGLFRRLDMPRGRAAWLDLVRELRRAAFDLALLLPNSFEAALVAWLVGARRRVGYAGDGRTRLLTDPVRPSRTSSHQVAAYLALLAPLDVVPGETSPTLRISAARQVEAQRTLAEVGLRSGDRTVAIQLSAAFGSSKLWAADRLATLAIRLDREGIRPVFLGSPSAIPLLQAVEARMSRPVTSLVGRDHPALLPALLAEFGVLVAPDSGPAHVGAAVGVPVVTLFGPTDPRLTAPLGVRHVALWRKPVCAPCFLRRCPIDHRCMEEMTVDEVLAAVLSRLAPGDAPVGQGRS